MLIRERLIAANALLKNFECCDIETSNDWWTIVEQVKEAPSVDAVEVVHGRWEDVYGGKYANPRHRCSVCGEKALYHMVRDVMGNWLDEEKMSPFCPNCGATMDGDS